MEGVSTMSVAMEAPDDLPIYPIRTVAQLSGVDARRLRSWEAEYQLLHPARTRGGHRLYSARDLRLIQEIRRLVDEEGMSLQGIRGWLAAQPPLPDRGLVPLPPTGGDRGNEAGGQANGSGQGNGSEARPHPAVRARAWHDPRR